jgi:multiple sugar transport system permease protein
MATTTAALPARSGESRRRGGGLSLEAGWGVALVLPYVVFFLIFVVWPVVYGAWIGSDPASYTELFSDPIFSRTALNTVVFLALAINLKLFLALLLSGFFATARPWIRWLSVIFILPWAVPSIPTIFSFRWMLNSEWGMVNGLLWDAFGIEGPWWLVDPQLAFGSVITVHIWKYLPFWTLILLAGRLSIPTDLYEAARIDGATPFQQFAYVTWPNLKNLYITSTLLSTIWSLGDFNSVYLLTGGGPAELTHVLATLGIRYAFNLHEIGVGVACVMVALPVLVPLRHPRPDDGGAHALVAPETSPETMYLRTA